MCRGLVQNNFGSDAAISLTSQIQNNIMSNAPDYDQSTAELIKTLLLDLPKDLMTIDPITAIRTDINKHVEFIKKHFHRPVENSVIFENGRPRRTFDFELDRLKEKAVAIYYHYLINRIGYELREILVSDKANVEFIAAARQMVNGATVELLKELEWPGDDMFMMMGNFMNQPQSEAIQHAIAIEGSPPESRTGIYAVLGLLIQAERYRDSGLMNEAYSCLIDASNIIGASNGARYARESLSKVAVKRSARENAQKKHAPKRKFKIQAWELFFDLKPNAERWKSAEFAAEKVHEKMRDISLASGQQDMPISFRTILKICQFLHRQTKTPV